MFLINVHKVNSNQMTLTEFLFRQIQLAAQNADIQTIRENRLVPVKSYRVSGSDGKNCRQPRNFQNLLVVSANSRLADGRLQMLRRGGTRFSEKVKSSPHRTI